MITVAETPTFRRKIETLLSPSERDDLIAYLAEHPFAGVLIQGTGGIRKLRWRTGATGKRGGIRVIYYFHSEMMPLYLLAAFGKNDKSDLAMRERQQLSDLVDELVRHWSKHHGNRIH